MLYGVYHLNERIAAFEAGTIEEACKNALQVVQPELQTRAEYDCAEWDQRKQVEIRFPGPYEGSIFVAPCVDSPEPYVRWGVFTGCVFAAFVAGSEAGSEGTNPYPGE